MAKTRLMIIFGGRSGEHEVSLSSARSVLAVLDPQKYEVTQVGITHTGQWLSGTDVLSAFEAGDISGLTPVTLRPEPGHNRLFALRGELLEPLTEIDVIFPALHGTFGEDGTIQGLFELAGIAYIGAGVTGSALGMDKALFKDLMRVNGIPVLPSLLFTRRAFEHDAQAVIDRIERFSPYPVFTKPSNLGSSVGITKCQNRSDLYEGLMEAARYDRRILVEKGLHKPREIEVSVLGNDQPQASVAGEVLPADDFYSYDAKYKDDRSQLFIPAQLPDDLHAYMRELAVRAYRSVDAAGMGRVDFLLDPANNAVYVSEINTIPGFTRISMYPKLWEASGLPYPALIDRLIELAVERKADRDRTEYRYQRS
jgi:D-alanine-D-alanine ligase